MMNKGLVYALWGYEAQNSDELSFREGDAITILRRKDENETEWWWARLGDREGYVPKNLLGVSTPEPGPEVLRLCAWYHTLPGTTALPQGLWHLEGPGLCSLGQQEVSTKHLSPVPRML